MDYSNFPDRERELFLCMQEVCVEKDKMTEIFPHVSETLCNPCWPLDQEQKGFFKEFTSDLDNFEQFTDKLADQEQLMLDSYAARIFLDEFRKTYGWELRILEDDDWHAAALAHGLRRDYPERRKRLSRCIGNPLRQEQYISHGAFARLIPYTSGLLCMVCLIIQPLGGAR